MGLAAFKMNDFQTAAFFMDAAVSEDIRNNTNDLDTPAHLFIQLRGDQPAQAAKEQVELAKSQMMHLIDIYNSNLGQNTTFSYFTINDLRNFFLIKSLLPCNKSWRSLTTTLISYVMEYDFRIRQMGLIVNPASNEVFLLHLLTPLQKPHNNNSLKPGRVEEMTETIAS